MKHRVSVEFTNTNIFNPIVLNPYRRRPDGLLHYSEVPAVKEAVITWLNDNVGKSETTTEIGRDWDDYPIWEISSGEWKNCILMGTKGPDKHVSAFSYPKHMLFYFNDLDKAMLFKLTWA